MPITILHVGAGPWSRAIHAPVLQRLGVRLGGICDIERARADAFRADFGYQRAFSSLTAAVDATEPEAIYVTVNPDATFAVVRQLLPLRIPLFIEKPPGISSVEGQALADGARASGTLTYVAFNRRRAPLIARLKAWADGRPVRYARAEMLRYNRAEPRFALETGIHAFDCARFLLGEPMHVTTHAAAHGWSAHIDFQNGAAADVDLITNCGVRRETYSLHLDGASSEAILGVGLVAWERGELTASFGDDPDPLVAGGFVAEHEAFLRAIATGIQPDCTLEDAARSLLLAEQVQNA